MRSSEHQLDLALLDLQGLHDAAQRRQVSSLDVDLHGMQVDTAGLDLGEVEQVVDQARQGVGRLPDIGESGAACSSFSGPSAWSASMRGEGRDRVERRAQLVADGRQELALDLAGALQLVGPLLQLGIERQHAAIGVLQLGVDLA